MGLVVSLKAIGIPPRRINFNFQQYFQQYFGLNSPLLLIYNEFVGLKQRLFCRSRENKSNHKIFSDCQEGFSNIPCWLKSIMEYLVHTAYVCTAYKKKHIITLKIFLSVVIMMWIMSELLVLLMLLVFYVPVEVQGGITEKGAELILKKKIFVSTVWL